ncbi:MAG: insulinase family protein, partial [Myxococcales bacterium]|nr:insulinase family protein [Myxococcales bacterium]
RAELWVGGDESGAWAEITTVRDSVPEVVALLAELLREPAFPAAELEILRRERIAQWQSMRSDPEARAQLALAQQLEPWPADDPRAHLTPDEAIARLRRVRRSDLVRLHRELWGSGDLQLVAVGDVDPEALRAVVVERLDGWVAPRAPERLPQRFHEVGGGEPLRIDTPDKELAVVLMGQTLRLRQDDPDYPALVLANHLLGGASDSRLLERLRQQDGFSYSAGSRLEVSALDAAGTLVAAAQCAPENASAVRGAMDEEIGRLLREGVGEQELAAGKASLRASFETWLTSDGAVADRQLEELSVGRTLVVVQRLYEAIDEVSADQLVEVLARHVAADRFVVVIAGDLGRAGLAAAP